MSLLDVEIAYNQPDPAYRKEAGVNQSSLKSILKSPAHYQAALNNKFLPTPAMELGTAAHCLLLDGKKAFESAYFDKGKEGKDLTVAEIKDALEKKGVEFRKSLKKAELEDLLYPDGKPVDRRKGLSSEDYAAVLGMAEQLTKIDWYQITDDAEYAKRNEVSIYWDWLGVRCKARLDSVLIEEGVVLDLKTTNSVEPDQFARKVQSLGYDFQAAFYAKAAQVAYGKPFKFVFAAVERVAPYHVQLFEVTPEMMAEGIIQCEDALHLYKQSMETNTWPEPEVIMHRLEYPRWRKPYQKRYNPVKLYEDAF